MVITYWGDILLKKVQKFISRLQEFNFTSCTVTSQTRQYVVLQTYLSMGWVLCEASYRLVRNIFQKYWSRGKTINSLAWDSRPSTLVSLIYLAVLPVNTSLPSGTLCLGSQTLACVNPIHLRCPVKCHLNTNFLDETKLLISSSDILLTLYLLTSVL